MSIETPFYDAFFSVDMNAIAALPTPGAWVTPNSGAAGDPSPLSSLGILAVKLTATGQLLVQLERPASATALIGQVELTGVAGATPPPSHLSRLNVFPAGTQVGYDGATYDNTNFRQIAVATSDGSLIDEAIFVWFFRAPAALPASAS